MSRWISCSTELTAPDGAVVVVVVEAVVLVVGSAVVVVEAVVVVVGGVVVVRRVVAVRRRVVAVLRAVVVFRVVGGDTLVVVAELRLMAVVREVPVDTSAAFRSVVLVPLDAVVGESELSALEESSADAFAASDDELVSPWSVFAGPAVKAGVELDVV